MHLSVAILLASSFVSAHKPSQAVLQQDQPQSFIQSYIFGRRDFDVQSLPDPVSLAPSYDIRELDDELPFTGIGTFAHLNYTNCFDPVASGTFDIAIVGHPFDLGVSYRPGARFGPNGARQGA